MFAYEKTQMQVGYYFKTARKYNQPLVWLSKRKLQVNIKTLLEDYSNFPDKAVEISPHKMKFPSMNKNRKADLNDKLIINKLKAINHPDIHITTNIIN